MRISDWSSDVCSSDLAVVRVRELVELRIVIFAVPGQTAAKFQASVEKAPANRPVDRILRYRLSQQEAGEKTVFHAVGHPPAGRAHGRSDTFVANLVRGHVTGAEVAAEAPVLVAALSLASGASIFVQIAEPPFGIPSYHLVSDV